MGRAAMKVGELARRTGVSVRTLHYYDEIGLLSPAEHTDAGHRLYGADEIVRLQQIRSLQQLGFSLDEIRALLERPDLPPGRVIALHVARLREQIRLQQRLVERLEAIATHVPEASVDEVLRAIEVMSMIARYYTPEQLEQLTARARAAGEARIREVEREWAALFEAVRAEVEAGTDPKHPRVRELALRCNELVREFTGGDPGIEKALRTMYAQEPVRPAAWGVAADPRLPEYTAYLQKALE